MQTVLLTGGAGYIGAHAAKSLARAGFLPVVYDDLSTGHREAVKWGPLEVGALAEADRLAGVVRKYAPVAVMHFAARAQVAQSVEDPAEYYRNNVAETLNLLAVMGERRVSRFIFSSSCAVYGVAGGAAVTERMLPRPVNPYGRGKWMVEQILGDYARAYGLRFAALRYFNAAGADAAAEAGERTDPPIRLIPRILDAAARGSGPVAVFGGGLPTRDGTCVRDYVHVSDLAEAHVLALDRVLSGASGIHVNLGSGEGRSVLEVIAAAERVTGRCIPVEYRPPRPGDPPELVADTRAALECLGWRPRRSSLESIIATAWNFRARNREAP